MIAETERLEPRSGSQSSMHGRDSLTCQDPAPSSACRLCPAQLLLSHYPPLTMDSSAGQKARHACLCPIHGPVAATTAYGLLLVSLFLVAATVLGTVGQPPNGTIFLLLVLVVAGLALGRLMTLIRLPALLGMLVAGIVLKNIPVVSFESDWSSWSSTLRSIALVIILMRAGLGLDPDALKRLSGLVFRLAFIPCLAETCVVAVAAHLLLGFPWLWGFMLGFVLAAVSPAVVVPCLLQLQEAGYGVSRGIPTLVIAAASVDDVLAISGFTILLGITFSPDASLVSLILQGPVEAAIGLIWGIAGGVLVSFLPHRNMARVGEVRFLLLFGSCLIALQGSKMMHLPGAGALAVLVMAFVAGLGWRKLGWSDDNPVSQYLTQLWFLFQPLLFGLIGTEIQISSIDQATLGLGVAVLAIGLSVRVVVTFFAVLDKQLLTRERLFIAMAWLPKATVQAAIGSVALDTARSMSPVQERDVELGHQVLTIAVLVILITAPIGAIAIMASAPKLLDREPPKADERTDDPDPA